MKPSTAEAPVDGYWIMTYVEVGVPGTGPSVQFETRLYNCKASGIRALREEWGSILSYWQDDDERGEWESGIAEALAALEADPSAPDISASVAAGELSWGELRVLCEGNWADFAPAAVDAMVAALAEHATEPDDDEADEPGAEEDDPDDAEAPPYAQATAMLTSLREAQNAGNLPTVDDITAASALVGECLEQAA